MDAGVLFLHIGAQADGGGGAWRSSSAGSRGAGWPVLVLDGDSRPPCQLAGGPDVHEVLGLPVMVVVEKRKEAAEQPNSRNITNSLRASNMPTSPLWI